MQRTIVVLGAGVMQIPLVKECKAMGLLTLCTDRTANAPAMRFADLPLAADISKPHQIIAALEAARKEIESLRGGLSSSLIDAVITAGTDFSTTVARVAAHYRLPGISYETALKARDKIVMRECLAKQGVRQPAFTAIESKADLANLITRLTAGDADPLRCPLVMKPADSMGARGVKYCSSGDELNEWYPQALKHSPTGRVIVEEYISGTELSIDALISSGQIFIRGIADRIIDPPPFFVEQGHLIPSAEDEEIIAEGCRAFKQAIRAVGIENGAAKGDIRISARKAYVCEVAARLSGGYMSGYTYPYASGVNLLRGAVQIALGQDPGSLKPTKDFISYESAITAQAGRLIEISGIEDALKIPEVKDIFILKKRGDIISKPQNNVEKAGNVIVTAKDKKSACAVMKKAMDLIRVITVPV